MKKGIFAVTIIFLASCATQKLATEPTAEDVKRGEKYYGGYTLEMLQSDKKIYEQKCNTCHKLKNPGKKTPEQWPSTVKRMAAKAEKNPEKRMTEQEQEQITRYLSVMSTAKRGY